MPQKCDTCRFCEVYTIPDNDDRWVCELNWGIPLDWLTVQGRHDDCPLIELPPHGRLIDADALKSDGFYTIVCYTGKMPYEYTAMLIDDAPTIIPAEEGE